MADTTISVAQDEFKCPICLDLLKDPVSIPCGHSYCMGCITDYWDQKRVYSCPQCRQTFTPRPVLGKNTVFAEMVKNLRGAPADYFIGPGDVECDSCTKRKRKAVKSCLECLNSYCQNHLEHHQNLFKHKRHKLMDATERLQETICSQHHKLQEVFCRTDQQCICILCTMDEHRHHDTVSVSEAKIEKQIQLEEIQRELQERMQDKQKELHELREAVETHKCSAQALVKESERIFTMLSHSIERSRSEVIQLIRDQENAEVIRAEELLKRLEQEIEDLKRRDAELEQLSHTDDHIHFLQSFQSLSVPPGYTNSLNITVSSHLSFDEVGNSLSKLTEVVHFCKREMGHISDGVKYIEIVSKPKPKTREEFLQYSHQFTLDQNTVNKNISLSQDKKMISYTDIDQLYSEHPERFDFDPQVLCRESVCGRCYWEVEWSGEVDISVSYKKIKRKSRNAKSAFGYNTQSWSLFCKARILFSSFPFNYPDSVSFSYSIWHNDKEEELLIHSKCSRIGVFLDHSAGTLSFYSVSDKMTLIHRVHTTFTQPLYPGFGVYSKSTLKLCDLSA
ncbi:tripartite motif-containing protein 16-like [Triplophysa dalaica]|uniref:tripartite motif-containing protein 16-like n=1 Tax=Triplophysa dalaica TaxID=1582913 RepID=UPI0024DFBE69|nr:tripartite motif-containing protein 16-like [Triplophysa dalaica]